MTTIVEAPDLKIGDTVYFYESRKLRTAAIEQFQTEDGLIHVVAHIPASFDSQRQIELHIPIDRIYRTKAKARGAVVKKYLPTVLMSMAGVPLIIFFFRGSPALIMLQFLWGVLQGAHIMELYNNERL